VTAVATVLPPPSTSGKGVARRGPKNETIYRMVMPEHICPYGLKAVDLLKREGFELDDHWLRTREETDGFKAEHQVKTAPQAFIAGERIGGYDDVMRYFGKDVPDPKATSHRPVVAVFGIAAALALATSWAACGALFTVRTAEWFVAMSMCLLAMLKLQDVERFSTVFLKYDLLAGRWVRYGYLQPTSSILSISSGSIEGRPLVL